MFADFLLRILGEDPVVFTSAKDKWAAVLGASTDFLVPQGQIVVFLIPFVVIWFRKKRFTFSNAFGATLIGIVLALAVYLLDEWFLIYGQAAAFKAFHGIE
jgi:FtsH-binding integral membrane protein